MTGCARVQTLNLEPHNYSERPEKIVWFQIAGLSEDHIPLLKFNVADTGFQTSFEQVSCLGKVWNYNLYNLRPEAHHSFISQMTGSKNIKASCADFSLNSVWGILGELSYSASILEAGADEKQSLAASLRCEQNKFLDISKVRLWKMGQTTQIDKKSFHYQDPPTALAETMNPGVYYDRSCQKGICFSTLSNNFKTLWSLVNKEVSKKIFIVRDFNFQTALIKRDINLAKESLQEIDRMIGLVRKESGGKILIIISGAESLQLEFPSQGKEWSEFEKNGKNVVFKKSALMSPVFAVGPMSENFCGIFDESEMLKRIIHKPERKKFSWDYINPF